MSWTIGTAISNLRTQLSDGPQDRIRSKKRIIEGVFDGTNKTFRTYEPRRVTDFTVSDAILGVYVDNVKVTVASDDPITGIFTLTTAPPNNRSTVTATYYYQWFLDSELTLFLTLACNWLGFTTTDQVTDGLKPTALAYASALSYKKLAIKFAETLSSSFKLEDLPDDKLKGQVDEYNKLGDALLESATKLRDQFYSRQGREVEPNWAMNTGAVPRVEPSR